MKTDMKEGHTVFIPDALDDAFQSVLSLPYFLEGIVPEIDTAAGGDKTVVADECDEGFRLFDHELLATDPVCIPETPQRIVALDLTTAELLLLPIKN